MITRLQFHNGEDYHEDIGFLISLEYGAYLWRKRLHYKLPKSILTSGLNPRPTEAVRSVRPDQNFSHSLQIKSCTVYKTINTIFSFE